MFMHSPNVAVFLNDLLYGSVLEMGMMLCSVVNTFLQFCLFLIQFVFQNNELQSYVFS